MGPTEEALSLADYLIREMGLSVDRIELGYAVMRWCDDAEVAQENGDE